MDRPVAEACRTGGGSCVSAHARSSCVSPYSFSERAAATIRENPGASVTVANPLDATANTMSDGLAAYPAVIRAALADPQVDQVIARAPPMR